MKLYYLLIIFLSILFIFSTCEQTTKDESKLTKEEERKIDTEEKLGKTQSTLKDDPEEIKKRREENEKKMQKKIKEYIKKLGIGESKTISKAEFKKIFGLLLEDSLNMALNEDSKKEPKKGKNDANIIQGFSDQIFNKLTKDAGERIEVDKIMSYFEPEKILNAMRDILSVFGLEKVVDDLLAPELRKMGDQLKEDMKKKNESSKKKNSDL